MEGIPCTTPGPAICRFRCFDSTHLRPLPNETSMPSGFWGLFMTTIVRNQVQSHSPTYGAYFYKGQKRGHSGRRHGGKSGKRCRRSPLT